MNSLSKRVGKCKIYKHNFLNNENQRKTLYLFQNTRHKTTNYFTKNSFFFSKTSNATKTNFPQKRFYIFTYFNKVCKSKENYLTKINFKIYENLRKIYLKANLNEVKAYKV